MWELYMKRVAEQIFIRPGVGEIFFDGEPVLLISITGPKERLERTLQTAKRGWMFREFQIEYAPELEVKKQKTTLKLAIQLDFLLSAANAENQAELLCQLVETITQNY